VLDAAGPYLSYAMVRRPDGPQLGDAETAPLDPATPAAEHLDTAVRNLVAGRPGAANGLVPFAIAYVVVPSDTTSRVRSALGRASALTVVPAPGSTVWRTVLPTGELSVLSGDGAVTALRGGTPVGPAEEVLPANAGAADTTLAPGAAGRIAVLAEPADSHWHATLNGSTLTARTAYGWAQAFELPSTGGHLQVGFSGGTRHWWLGAQLVLVIVVILAALPARRPDDLDGLT
jgi:hypothetical protein